MKTCEGRQVMNLGVHLDTSMTMERRVTTISSACYCHTRNIGSIRLYITTDVCKTLAHALVTARLDYGNTVPRTLMERLRRVENSTHRLVTRTRKREHVTPVLNSLRRDSLRGTSLST